MCSFFFPQVSQIFVQNCLHVNSCLVGWHMTENEFSAFKALRSESDLTEISLLSAQIGRISEISREQPKQPQMSEISCEMVAHRRK